MKEVIFTADYFKDDYRGGAELTTDAIMTQRPEDLRVYRVHASKVTQEFVEKHKDKHWVVCNFSSLEDNPCFFLLRDFNSFLNPFSF